MDGKQTHSTIFTAEADAAFSIGHWGRASALYDEALDAMPRDTRKQRAEWARVARLQQSAADSVSFIRAIRK